MQKHPQVDTAIRHIEAYIKKLKLGNWLHLRSEGRYLSLEVDESALKEDSTLDECYVIKSNLPAEHASKYTIHERYKDLSKVEKAFRTFKQDFLEVRPVFVGNEKSTKGHVFVVMLSYMIEQYLEQAWSNIDIPPQEGIQQLSTLCSTELNYKGGSCHQIPTPASETDQSLQALNISLPATLPNQRVQVDTRKKVAK